MLHQKRLLLDRSLTHGYTGGRSVADCIGVATFSGRG